MTDPDYEIIIDKRALKDLRSIPEIIAKKFKKTMHEARPLKHIHDKILIPPDVHRNAKWGRKIDPLEFRGRFQKNLIELLNPGHPA